MKILGLIPARGGSKRIPGKNIKILGGVPLIAWTIQRALASKAFMEVVVSTDDPEICKISEDYGAKVYGLRPRELATNIATSIDVAIHSLDLVESLRGPIDGLMLLQPTSPFRSKETILRAVKLYEESGRRPVVGVCPADPHPSWTFSVKDHVLIPFSGWQEMKRRSQGLEPAYALNGAMYLLSPATLRSAQSFVTENTCPLVIDDPVESVDIDTEWDWKIAEAIISCGQLKLEL